MRYFPVKNQSTELAPAFAVCKAGGAFDADKAAIGFLKPDTDNELVMSLDEFSIDAAQYGHATYENEVRVAYDDTDGIPAIGEEWGVKAGSWKIRKGYKGFFIIGGASAGVVNTVRIAPQGCGGPTYSQTIVTDVTFDPVNCAPAVTKATVIFGGCVITSSDITTALTGVGLPAGTYP